MAKPRPPCRPRVLRRLALFLLLLIVAVANLPWLASFGPARAIGLGILNARFAPTRMSVVGASASWFGPIRLRGLVLKNDKGKVLVSAPTASWNRTLFQVLFDRSDYGTLTFFGPSLDIERTVDGKIDLAEALRPILASSAGDPGPGASSGSEAGEATPPFTLAIEKGSLALKSPELSRPITTDNLDLVLRTGPSPNPLSWDISLNGTDGDAESKMKLSGTSDAGAEGSPVHIDIHSVSWPLAVSTNGVDVQGVLTGGLVMDVVGADARITGDAKLSDASAAGPALKGDSPNLGEIIAKFDLTTGKNTFALHSLKATTLAGSFEATTDGSTRVVGKLDLAALARLFPKTLSVREGLVVERGELSIEVATNAIDGGDRMIISADLHDLSAALGQERVNLTQPMSFRAEGTRINGSVEVDHATMTTPFLAAEGRGSLEAGVTVTGTASLDALHRELAQFIDLGEVALSGNARFGGDLKRDSGSVAYTGRVAIEAEDLRVAGLTSTPIERPKARFDATAQGPLGADGLPVSWKKLDFNLKSGLVQARLQASDSSSGTAFQARITGPKAEVLTLLGAGPIESQGLLEPPLRAELDATYNSTADSLAINRATLGSVDGTIDAAGLIEGLTGPRMADLRGTLSPNWKSIEAKISAGAMTPAEVSGKPSPFRLKGRLSGADSAEIIRGLDAELSLDLAGAELLGVKLGPAPLRVHAIDGKILIDPIQTTLNGGRVDLRPIVRLPDDGSIVLAIEPGGVVEQAEINEPLSRTLLSYVAPVLHGATQIDGKLSVRFDRLEVPISGPSAGEGIELASQVTFHNVTYGPGPITREVLLMSGVEGDPRLRLNQVVTVDVHDNRVWQSGLSIQAGKDVTLELTGSVGFDTTVALNTSIPLSARIAGGGKLAEDLVAGSRVDIPIGGTLAHPKIDRAAFRLALRQASGQLLNRAAGREARDLLDRLGIDDVLPAEVAQGTRPPGEKAERSIEGELKNLGRNLLREIVKPE
jgi:hypothetical protein